MAAQTGNTTQNNDKKHATQNEGPRLREASVVQLLKAVIQKTTDVTHEAETSRQIGHPNRLFEELVSLMRSNGVLTRAESLLRFTSQPLNSAVWYSLFRWNEKANTEMPAKVYKYQKESDEEGFLIDNPTYDKEFARAYFSPSTGDGCRLGPAYLNNCLRVLTHKLQSLYEHVLFAHVKPADRKVTNFSLRQKVYDEETGKSYFTEFDNQDDILQVMTLVTLVTQFNQSTVSIDFRVLAERLPTLLRSKEEQDAYVTARKSYYRSQKELGRETTLNSLSTPEIQAQLEKVQNLPMSAPRKAQTTTAWKHRTETTTAPSTTDTVTVPTTDTVTVPTTDTVTVPTTDPSTTDTVTHQDAEWEVVGTPVQPTRGRRQTRRQ